MRIGQLAMQVDWLKKKSAELLRVNPIFDHLRSKVEVCHEMDS